MKLMSLNQVANFNPRDLDALEDSVAAAQPEPRTFGKKKDLRHEDWKESMSWATPSSFNNLRLN